MYKNLYPAPTCMECGQIVKVTEEIQTNDELSPDGCELWCWCPDCQVDTFHLPLEDAEI